MASAIRTTWVTLMTTTTLLAILLLALFASNTEASSTKNWKVVKETNLVFFMQDYETGKNFSAIPVAGVNGTKSGVLGFGTVMVIDDALTEGIEKHSKQVGRAQGMYVNSALDGSDLHFLLSVVFTDEKYNGSTLEIQGANRFFLKQREVSVVSGTGYFRFARGFAILETVVLDIPNLNAVLKINVTVLHY
ncbi:hypothetical protein H6P81_013721 [Aristolochia fimbriata]|uniref:Dirigent protein n=1 Tax=Aristolochia fimbriata TaxID=158543 RepID=A0AAV7EFG8_ARIFI|nr:hypothetical protein H6P81_013721 [Aristolochia fimbriata]